MNNKIFASLVVLLLCKSLTLAAGGGQGKDQQDPNLSSEARVGHFIICAAAGSLCDLKKDLDDGIDVNAKNSNGRTALMSAISFGKTETIHLLVGRGACVTQANDEGQSAVYRFLTGEDPKGLNVDTLRLLLRNSRCPHPPITGLAFQAPEDILVALQADSCDYARRQADFLAENIEAVKGTQYAAVAQALAAHKIFPQHSVIHRTILSYVSVYDASERQRPRTYCTHQKNSKARRKK